jgi:hypothetical protein
MQPEKLPAGFTVPAVWAAVQLSTAWSLGALREGMLHPGRRLDYTGSEVQGSAQPLVARSLKYLFLGGQSDRKRNFPFNIRAYL